MAEDLGVLQSAKKVMGAKQVARALRRGEVRAVFLAQDADSRVTDPVAALCGGQGIAYATVESMAKLGSACGLAVGSAVAAVLK
jgi:large subunit ribosomal protein L7A